MDYQKLAEGALSGDGLSIYDAFPKEGNKCGQLEILREIHRSSQELEGVVNRLTLSVTINGADENSRNLTLFLGDGYRKSYVPVVTIEGIPNWCP